MTEVQGKRTGAERKVPEADPDRLGAGGFWQKEKEENRPEKMRRRGHWQEWRFFWSVRWRLYLQFGS